MPDPNEVQSESYLVRLWRDSQLWRAFLQNIRTGETQYFTEPKKLWDYLQGEMANDVGQETGQVKSEQGDFQNLASAIDQKKHQRGPDRTESDYVD